MIKINIQRVYDQTKDFKSPCFLVDRLWPRGIKKEELVRATWLPEVAPSNSLRKWFGHDPKKWQEFMKRYFKELDANPKSWQLILKAAKKETVTLLYSAKDTKHNQAVALQAYLLKK